MPPPYGRGGIKRYRDPSVCLSQPRLYGTLAACSLATASHLCGLRTRPRTDVDPPRIFPPSNCHRRGAYRLAVPGEIPCFTHILSASCMGGNSDDVFASIVGYTIVKYLNQRAASFRFLAPLSSHYFHPIYSFLHLFFSVLLSFFISHFHGRGGMGMTCCTASRRRLTVLYFFYNFNVWLRFK